MSRYFMLVIENGKTIGRHIFYGVGTCTGFSDMLYYAFYAYSLKQHQVCAILPKDPCEDSMKRLLDLEPIVREHGNIVARAGWIIPWYWPMVSGNTSIGDVLPHLYSLNLSQTGTRSVDTFDWTQGWMFRGSLFMNNEQQ